MFDYKIRKDGVGYMADRRKAKRAERKFVLDPIYEAHCLGQEASGCDGYIAPRVKRGNPYPPGRRHDTFETAKSHRWET